MLTTSPTSADLLKLCVERRVPQNPWQPPQSLLICSQPHSRAPPVLSSRGLNGSPGSQEPRAAPRPAPESGSLLSHPPPRVRKSASPSPSSGSWRPAGFEVPWSRPSRLRACRFVSALSIGAVPRLRVGGAGRTGGRLPQPGSFWERGLGTRPGSMPRGLVVLEARRVHSVAARISEES